MCGIVAVIGSREAGPLLLEGLRQLEYRGYDSAGIAVISKGKLERRRSVGKVELLAKMLEAEPLTVRYPVPPAGWTLAVSFEPAGGSPTGAPTGPVILSAVSTGGT